MLRIGKAPGWGDQEIKNQEFPGLLKKAGIKLIVVKNLSPWKVLTTIVLIQAVVALIRVVKGFFLSFLVGSFLLQREREGKSAEILPVAWQQKITVAFILPFLGWWGCLLLTVIDILSSR
jgi:hypothetical protein